MDPRSRHHSADPSFYGGLIPEDFFVEEKGSAFFLLVSSLAHHSDDHGPKRARYSLVAMNALTMSALTKLPLNWFSFVSQNS